MFDKENENEQYKKRGAELKEQAKLLVMDFMNNTKVCHSDGEGMSQTDIFKDCGFGWEDYGVAKPNNQVSWLVALLWDLSRNGKVKRIPARKKWRLTKGG